MRERGKRVVMPMTDGLGSMTHQCFKDECDINSIMQKYVKTGLIDHAKQYQGNYADITDSLSFQDALNTVLNAHNMFDSLPSTIRKRFSNDPYEFLAFTEDPNNVQELIEMGLGKESPIIENKIDQKPKASDSNVE